MTSAGGFIYAIGAEGEPSVQRGKTARPGAFVALADVRRA
jgi:hypothetical protein